MMFVQLGEAPGGLVMLNWKGKGSPKGLIRGFLSVWGKPPWLVSWIQLGFTNESEFAVEYNDI